ncbi:MAG TPA: AsmA family protein [Verrucomicrobiae bacterium]|nr:AsmA family protein [Verrucomicrobiae bacterium]
MKRVLKWIAIIIAIIIVLILVLPFVINVNDFRPRIESELTNALGRKVTVGNLSLSLWSGSLAADNIAIADDPGFSNAPFVKAESLNVGVNMVPLIFSKTLQIRDITLNRPQVSLLRKPDGKWNFSTIGTQAPENGGAAQTGAAQTAESPKPRSKTASKSATKSSTPEQKPSQPASAPSPESKSSSEQGLEQNLSVGALNIRSGQISMADTNAPGKAHVYRDVDVTVKNFSFSSQFPFTVSAGLPGGGTVKLDGNGGPINRNDASLTPLQAKISVNQLDLAKSGFIDPSSGFAGVANFSGSVQSDGNQARSSGDATAEHLKLSPKGTPAQSTVAMKYSTNYELQKQTGELSGDVSIVKASAKLSGTYDLHGESAVLHMKLNADNMPVDDLETLLPALGVELPKGSKLQGGTLTADVTINGAVNQLVIAGPVKLANTKLAGFDLGSKFSSVAALSGAKTGPDTSIQNLSTDVHYSPSGIQTNNVDLSIPALGTIKGNGTVSPQNALDYKMTAAFNGAVVSGLTKMAGVGGNGTTVPFTVTGTASDPKIMPDVKGMLGNQLGNQLKKNLGSQIPGGQNGQGVVDAIGGLFGKKKPKQ